MVNLILALLISGLSLSVQASQAWSIECPPKVPFSYCLIAEGAIRFVWLSRDWTALGIMTPGLIEIRDPYTGQITGRITAPRLKGVPAFSFDGRLLATPMDDQTIWVWEVKTGRKLWRLPAGVSAAFGPGGKLLYCSGLKGEIVVWDMDTGTQVQSLHQLEPVGMTIVRAVSPDGRWLVGVPWLWRQIDIARQTDATEYTTDVTIASVVWDLYTGNLVRVFPGWWVFFLSKDQVLILEFDLMSGLPKIVVWEILGPKMWETPIPLKGVGALSVRRDGQYIAFALADGTVRFWKVDTAQEVAKLDLKALLVAKPDIKFVEFSPDGDHLLIAVKTAPGEVQVHLWNVSGLLAGK